MPLPAIGIFGVITAWIIKKVGFKLLITVLQWTMITAAIAASLSLFAMFVMLATRIFNLINSVVVEYDLMSTSTHVSIQVANASGLLPALTDTIGVFLPFLYLFITYKAAMMFKNLVWKFTRAVFEIGMMIQA